MNKAMRVISASFAAVLLCLTVVSLPAPVRGESLRRPTPDSLARPEALVHKFGLDVSPGALFRTDDFFKGANAAGKEFGTTLSVHLKYAFQFGPETRFGRNYPFTYQGVGLGYNTFFNSAEVGTPVALYVFQHARIAALTERLSLDYEWNFGLSFGWKPFDEQTNPFNTVVGSKINAYINLGLMLNWRFAPRWSLTAGVGLTHFSNGNTRYPNGGVNLIGGRVGVMRTFGRDAADDRRAAVRRSDPFRPYVSYDVILYGALRKKGFLQESRAYLIPGSFAVAGLNFTPMYNFSRFFRAGLSLQPQRPYRQRLSAGRRTQIPPSALQGAVRRGGVDPLRGRDADLFDQSGYRQEPDRQGRRHEFVLPGLRPQSRCGVQRLPARRVSALQVPQSEQPDAGRRLPVQRALTVRCTIEIK